MKDTDGKPFVIEINSNPGTGIIGITGYNHFKDLVKYCERNYRKEIHQNIISPTTPDKQPESQPDTPQESLSRWQKYLAENKYYQSLRKDGFL